MNQKPKYFLKYGTTEIENDSLEEIMRLVKHLTVYWEVYRVYRSCPEEHKQIFNIRMIEEAFRLKKRGYNYTTIEKQLGIRRHFLEKILGKNAIVQI